MRVAIICPVPAGSRLGNRITAVRWARMLRELGHRVFLADPGPAPRCDVLIALHARRSAESIRSSKEGAPARPVALALTGTDLYRDIHQDATAARSLELADRLIVLHPGAARELPPRLHGKISLVPQSAPVPARKPKPVAAAFEVAVVAHLRPEKDPLRAAVAARLLPEKSRVRVVHAGRALSPEAAAAARLEQRENRRYRWIGEVPRSRARALIGRARLLAVTSEMEGGANVVSEAVAAGTPVIASRIPSMEAILGPAYPGLFPFGDARALSRLLARAEEDPAFLERLRRRSIALRPALSPAREKAALRALLAALAPPRAIRRRAPARPRGAAAPSR